MACSKNHAANTCTWDFPDVKFHIPVLDIGENNLVPEKTIIWIGLKS